MLKLLLFVPPNLMRLYDSWLDALILFRLCQNAAAHELVVQLLFLPYEREPLHMYLTRLLLGLFMPLRHF